MMVAHVVQNPLETEAPPEPPEGTNYGFEMMFDAGRSRAWANTAEELIDVLIPGYLTMSLDDRLKARLDLALHVKAATQANLNVAADLTDESEETIAALSAGAIPPPITTWSSHLPLIVLDLHYKPYTDLEAPVAEGEGNLLWFKANDEDDLIDSLNLAGFITLGRRNV